MKKFHVGISGWNYPRWRKTFYPPGLKQREELIYASRAFPTIELNGSFYSLQRPESFRTWYRETPPGFLFSVKGGRFITHMKKLKDVEVPLANFFASGVLALEEKLGPILWQFPPNLPYTRERFERFFQQLPRNFQEASLLASLHDARLEGRSLVETTHRGRIRHAVEIRHESFLQPDFFKLLQEYEIAFVIADSAGKFPYHEAITTDFVYIRLHGGSELYVSGYSPPELDAWAKRVRKWSGTSSRKRDVYVYFDNDAKVHAPFDAQALIDRLAPGRSRVPPPDFQKTIPTAGSPLQG